MRRDDSEIEKIDAYIWGRVEAQLEGFSAGFNIPKQHLAARLAEHLQELNQTIRERSGVADRVRYMRRQTRSSVDQRAEAQVVGSAPTTRARVKGSPKGFKYAPGTHWTQKPENKARLKKMARKNRKTALTTGS